MRRCLTNSFLSTVRTAQLLALLIFLSGNLRAQKRNNVWAFGDAAGLNFNTNPVSVFNSKSEGIQPPYYISSICAPDGELLFYTDGHTVWNRDNFKMPLYKKFWLWSENVIPLITPYIQNDSLYYIFGVEGAGDFGPPPNANKLVYFTTKMYNPGDIEEVVYPQPTSNLFFTTLLSNASPVLAGTDHCNTVDRWIVTHAPGALYSFLITKNGVNPVPVVTSIPSTFLPVEKLNVKYSNLKFSANSERLIFPDNTSNKIIVFDFDNLTGKFSNPISLSIPDKELLEDVELSPDGNKLYFGSYIIQEDDVGAEVHYIYQMDLNAGSVAAIENSLYRVNRNGDRVVCFRTCYKINRTMQLGPDGRIYISKREGTPVAFDETLAVIEDPSKSGSAISYQGGKINLKRMCRFLNYNYVRSGSFTPRENSIQYKKNTCIDLPVDFSLIFNRADSVKWNFGDPQSGTGNVSQLKKPQHQYPGAGTYNVTAVIYDRCFIDTAAAVAIVSEDEAVKVSPSIKDTVLCTGEVLQLDATTPGTTDYYWDNRSTNPQRKIDGPGEYSLTVYNACSFDSKFFKVSFNVCPCSSHIPNAFSPNYDGLNDVFKPIIECVPREYQFEVYDRYGNIVFKTGNPGEGWNGKKNGNDYPQGVYAWILRYRHPGTKQTVSKKGVVTLLR